MIKAKAKRVFSRLIGIAVGMSSFGVSVQTFAESAKPLSGVADNADLPGGEYSISTPEELDKLAKLVNGGHATAEGLSFVLTTSLDLTEGGAYTHGYCDKPIYVGGKVVGWYKAEEKKDDGAVEWGLVPEINTDDMTEITEGTTAADLKENGQYWIKDAEGYNKFLELDGKYPEGISVVLLGGVENGAFVEPVKDKDDKLLSGWCEAEFSSSGRYFHKWKKTGNGGGVLHPYREFYQQIYSQV